MPAAYVRQGGNGAAAGAGDYRAYGLPIMMLGTMEEGLPNVPCARSGQPQ